MFNRFNWNIYIVGELVYFVRYKGSIQISDFGVRLDVMGISRSGTFFPHLFLNNDMVKCASRMISLIRKHWID